MLFRKISVNNQSACYIQYLKLYQHWYLDFVWIYKKKYVIIIKNKIIKSAILDW